MLRPDSLQYCREAKRITSLPGETGAAKGPRNKASFGWGGFWGSTYWADPKAH